MEIKGLSFSDQMRGLSEIEGIGPIVPNPAQGKEETNKASFAEFLNESMQKVNDIGLESDRAIQGAMLDENASPHEVMIALQKADVSFRLMLSIKQRLEQAYQELIRTPLG